MEWCIVGLKLKHQDVWLALISLFDLEKRIKFAMEPPSTFTEAQWKDLSSKLVTDLK